MAEHYIPKSPGGSKFDALIGIRRMDAGPKELGKWISTSRFMLDALAVRALQAPDVRRVLNMPEEQDRPGR